MNQARLLRYFEEELAYLASAGPRFSRRYPDRAALVSLDNVTSRDPDVERLIQAFAFLAGQVRAELHDELPQITDTLLGLLWPDSLRPVPSTAVVEFRPDLAQLETPLRITGGKATVESVPITSPESGRDFTCRFRTTMDLEIVPMRLVSAEVVRQPTRSELVIRLELGSATDPNTIWQSLRLHLAGDPIIALDMRHWLLDRIHAGGITAEATIPEQPKVRSLIGPIRPVGLGAGDTLLGSGRLSLPGFRLVQEYFLARHKFLYVDIEGLDRLGPMPAESKIEIRIPFKDHPPERVRFSAETLRLNCAPVINLFPSAAVPIRYDSRRADYELLADHDTQAVAIQRVTRVFGQVPGAPGPREYRNFLEFRHSPGNLDPSYQVSVQAGVDGRPQWRLMLAHPEGVVPAQVVSVDLDCSNGDLAAALLPGDIRFRGDGIPDMIEVKNLTQPEAIHQPPIDSASPWRFISHLAMNYLTLEDPSALIGALKLYDWSSTQTNWRRLQGIRSLRGSAGCTIVDGIPLRGRDLTVELDPTHFANVGDAYLFSEVLSHFFALYANINSYTRLETRLTGIATFRWPALNGRQRPL